MMKWKRIVTAILRTLWMLRLVTPRDNDERPPTKEARRESDDERPPTKGARRESNDEKRPTTKRARQDNDDERPPTKKARRESDNEERPMTKRARRDDDEERPPTKGARRDNEAKKSPQTPPSKSECGLNAGAHAVAGSGPRCSRLLPRSQVLSLLRLECRRSTRKIDLLVLHCSDTRPDQDFTIEKLMACHRARGFGAYPGYHLYVRRDGSLYYCRPVAIRGCHVKGFNSHSIGICYEGGRSLSADRKYEDTRTAEQLQTLDEVLRLLHEIYPHARLVGHHELNPRKACPCLSPSASSEYAYIFDR